jgi:hypothetical protein
MDELVGSTLVKVERLGWRRPGEPGDLSVGPVHLVFEDGRGIFLGGRSDWSLELVQTSPEDNAWLDVYDYDGDGGWRWVLRDASTELPFTSVITKPLTALAPMHNEIGEMIGLRLNFGGQSLTLRTRQGEVTT